MTTEASPEQTTQPTTEQKPSPITFQCIWQNSPIPIEIPPETSFSDAKSRIQSLLTDIGDSPLILRCETGPTETSNIDSDESWQSFCALPVKNMIALRCDEVIQFDFSRLISRLDVMAKVQPLSILEETAALEQTEDVKDEDGDSEMEEVATAAEKTISSNRDGLPWGAGVGYGCSYDNSYWDMDTWQNDQTTYHSNLTAVLQGINERIGKNDVDLSVIRQCCIIPFCIEQVSSSSIASMKRFQSFYKEVFSMIVLLCQNETTRPIVGEDVLVTTKSRANLWKAFSNLNKQATQAASLSSSALDESDFVEDITRCYNEAASALGLQENAMDTDETKEAPEQSYIEAMESLRFNTVSSFTSQKYQTEGSGDALSNKKLIRRLAGEYADISVSLPLTEESSIFVRVNETHMNLCRFLVVPADETPYASGCFIFDVSFPQSYPDSPPKVNLATTGGGTVRFNPNLYNDGYVCLSLLGTWDAESAGEEWIPGVSTFLQVVISVQSLIFVPDPYWNEPGFESNASDPSEQSNCEEYNRDKQINTVRWAMIDQLLHPPAEFARVILRHFFLSKERVVRNATDWLGAQHELVVKLECILEQLNEDVWNETPVIPTEPSAEQLEAFKAKRNGGVEPDAGDGDVVVEDVSATQEVAQEEVTAEPMSVDPPVAAQSESVES